MLDYIAERKHIAVIPPINRRYFAVIRRRPINGSDAACEMAR
jgi:hypothetical protein